MSDDRPKGFLSRVFGPVEDDDHTSVYSGRDREDYDDYDDYDGEADEEPGAADGSFTVERAAEIIKHLPPEVPRSSAVRIVRQTLVAAGINMDDLTRSTLDREERLNSEISHREAKISDLRQRTDETVRDLERSIREAREDRDTGVAAEERRITTARTGLEDVERVRDFFDLPLDPDEPSVAREDPVSDDTHVIDRASVENELDDDTRVIGRPEASELEDDWNGTGRGRREDAGGSGY
ncbi:hypothetical protein [Rubrobacter indicoceani]|uniref:hypothetical protein n=1 Tax=Rubrobacter indicoceani TaxID=2051957 RepID=UPI000E5AF07B|nr:hypothetical protein [Rubrobacter indicoceani]